MNDTPCPICNGTGLVNPPPYTHIHAPMYAALVALRVVGRLEFCKCSRGEGTHRALKVRYQDIQSGRDKFPNWQEILDEATMPTVNGGA